MINKYGLLARIENLEYLVRSASTGDPSGSTDADESLKITCEECFDTGIITCSGHKDGSYQEWAGECSCVLR